LTAGASLITSVRLPPAFVQQMAADDVASGVGRVAVGAPVNGMVEIAGPEQFRLDELIRGALTKRNDPREVATDPQARHFGINPSEGALLLSADARVAETRFSDWLEQQLATASP
jgi:hypothetical protein